MVSEFKNILNLLFFPNYALQRRHRRKINLNINKASKRLLTHSKLSSVDSTTTTNTTTTTNACAHVHSVLHTLKSEREKRQSEH